MVEDSIAWDWNVSLYGSEWATQTEAFISNVELSQAIDGLRIPYCLDPSSIVIASYVGYETTPFYIFGDSVVIPGWPVDQ